MRDGFHFKFPVGLSTHARSLGWATSILAAGCHRNRNRPMVYVNEVLSPAIRHGQIGFVANRHNREVGYFVWATLHPYTMAHMEKYRVYPPWESDWSELGDAALIDLVTVEPLHRGIIIAIYKTIAKQGIPPSRALRRFRTDFSFKPIDLARFGERHR